MVVIHALFWFFSRRPSSVWWGFRYIMLQRLSSFPWFRAIFAGMGFLFALGSISGEAIFAAGMRLGRFDMLQIAGVLWPFERSVREAAAHAVMVSPAPPGLAILTLEDALAKNPHSADLMLAAMQYRTVIGDQAGTQIMFSRLKAVLSIKYMAPAIIKSVAFNPPS